MIEERRVEVSEIQSILTRFWDQLIAQPSGPLAFRSASPRSRTRLVLPSECDRQLLTTAATKLVAEHRGTILEFLNRP